MKKFNPTLMIIYLIIIMVSIFIIGFSCGRVDATKKLTAAYDNMRKANNLRTKTLIELSYNSGMNNVLTAVTKNKKYGISIKKSIELRTMADTSYLFEFR